MKKKFYAIGSLIAVIAPTMAIVSCTDSDNPVNNPVNNPSDNPGSKDTNIVKSDKITLAQWYKDQETVYVEYEDNATRLDQQSGALKEDVTTAIANFAQSVPTLKSFNTLMVRIKGLFGGNDLTSNKKVYTMEISGTNGAYLNGVKAASFKQLITSEWGSKVLFKEADATPKNSTDFSNVALSGWNSKTRAAVTQAINPWDTSHLMSWRGGMSKNFASSVKDVGSKSNLNNLVDSDFTEEIVQRLFLANEDVLGEDHQSTLLTIIWYYKNAGGIASKINEAVAIGIHKAFVDAWNNSFTREKNDLDPETFLDGLAAVSPDLASFVTSNVPFVKEEL